MEIGDLQKDVIEAWVPFGSDGEILIRYIPKDELMAIHKKATRRDWHKGQMREEMDMKKANRLIGRAAVLGWRNLTMAGKPFEFNEVNLDLLMDKSYEFSIFVSNTCTEIQEFVDGKRADEEKN